MIDIFARIEAGDYSVDHLRPPHGRPARNCFNNDCGKHLTDVTKFCPHCGKPFESKYSAALAERKKQQDDYNAVSAKRFNQFKADAIEYCEIIGHPKADEAFSKAYEDGDKNLRRTIEELEELSEFMKFHLMCDDKILSLCFALVTKQIKQDFDGWNLKKFKEWFVAQLEK